MHFRPGPHKIPRPTALGPIFIRGDSYCLHTCTPAALEPACQVPTRPSCMGPPVPTSSQHAKWTRPVSRTNMGSTSLLPCQRKCTRAITSVFLPSILDACPACQSLVGLHNMSVLRGSQVASPSGPHGEMCQFRKRGPICQSLVGLYNLSGPFGSHVVFPSSPQGDVGPTGFTRCPTCQLHIEVSLGQISSLKTQVLFIQVETRQPEEPSLYRLFDQVANYALRCP